jgi:hypothetical protein
VIDAGLPRNRAEWPDGVLDALRPWEQGDVVNRPPFFYFVDRRRAVWRYGTDEPGAPIDDVLWITEGDGPRFGVVTTQTCDISEEDSNEPKRPWVQISPVYEMRQKGYLKSLASGRGPAYLAQLPGITDAGTWVADLRVEIPFDKGWLAQQDRVSGFSTSAERRDFSDRVAWIRNRPALSSEFNRSIRRSLDSAIVTLEASDADMYATVLSAVSEVGARLDDLDNPASVQLVLIGQNPISTEVREWFEGWWSEAHAAASSEGIVLHALGFTSFDSMSAGDYRALVILSRWGPG